VFVAIHKEHTNIYITLVQAGKIFQWYIQQQKIVQDLTRKGAFYVQESCKHFLAGYFLLGMFEVLTNL